MAPLVPRLAYSNRSACSAGEIYLSNGLGKHLRCHDESVCLGENSSAMTYTVRIERDESGAWLARVPAVPGCRTHGRSLRQVKRRIREDLSLRVADAHRAELSFEIQLPPDARHLVRTAHSARDAADRTQREARETTRRAAGELTKSFLGSGCR
jgi:predicted RNase H-like HicB family nuclease